MRNIVFKDILISQSQYDKLVKDYVSFYKEQAGLDVTFTTLDYDFKDYPTYLDEDGDDRPTESFVTSLKDRVVSLYGKYGADNIVLLIHDKNWKSGRNATRTGIWGTNWSYRYGNFHVQYSRFDSTNPINSFGTLNHEHDHTFDALIQVEIGVDVRKILDVANYDKLTTHGGKPDETDKAYHGYIRNKENAEKLKVLSPYLKAAYTKRRERHEADVLKKQKTIISLLEEVVYLYKKLINQKNGNPNNHVI